MKILAIETSCDETAVAVLEGTTSGETSTFTVLGNALLSQIDIHKEYGGVYPAVAKREHAKNLVPLLAESLTEAGLIQKGEESISEEIQEKLARILEREPGLAAGFLEFVAKIKQPPIDAIAVTEGPGLEPALWVGVNFARALSLVWNLPLVGVNHMEGHIFSALATRTSAAELSLTRPSLPLLALLISGGHTELVLMREWLTYSLVGQTRDDACGEAFDKVARMLGLPYPGGPHMSQYAERDRDTGEKNSTNLPRPMIDSPDFDFSFSGLKTAVLYYLKARGDIGEREKEQVARAFEDAVADVLYKKTERAIEEKGARALAIGGGVSASKHIRRVFTEGMQKRFPDVALFIPPPDLTGDNAIMIGIASYFRAGRKEFRETLRARGTFSLT